MSPALTVLAVEASLAVIGARHHLCEVLARPDATQDEITKARVDVANAELNRINVFSLCVEAMERVFQDATGPSAALFGVRG